MKMLEQRNPESINDIDCSGRKARYVGGTSSPAVWYWGLVRGDITAINSARPKGSSIPKGYTLVGIRFCGGRKYVAVAMLNSGYYEEFSLPNFDPISTYMGSIGSRGGSAKTPAKRKASRENGKKGGRPKISETGSR